MSAGLPVKRNQSIATYPRLSAGGRPIGDLKRAHSLPCEPVGGRLRGQNIRSLGAAQRGAPGNCVYYGPIRGIYNRPRATRVDTYC